MYSVVLCGLKSWVVTGGDDVHNSRIPVKKSRPHKGIIAPGFQNTLRLVPAPAGRRAG